VPPVTEVRVGDEKKQLGVVAVVLLPQHRAIILDGLELFLWSNVRNMTPYGLAQPSSSIIIISYI